MCWDEDDGGEELEKGHFVCLVRQASFVCCIVVNAAMSWSFHYNMFPMLKIP